MILVKIVTLGKLTTLIILIKGGWLIVSVGN